MAKKRNNWPKIVLQWGTLAAIVFFLSGLAAKIFTKMPAPDPETYCPAGGIQAFITYLVRGSLPCSMSSLQIIVGLAMAAGVILFSKLFCGYICPVGTIEDLLGKLRKAIGLKPIRIAQRSILDSILRIIKYVLLFWIFYMTATTSELFCKNLDPYYATATGFKGEITLWMSIITVSLVILGGLFIDRFWCKYICPLGAASNSFKFWIPLGAIALIYWALVKLGLDINWFWLLAAMCLAGYLCEILVGRSRTQLLYIVKDEDVCTNCGACNKVCPYAIDIKGEGARVTNVDCTLCGECISACATRALGVGRKKSKCEFAKFLPAIFAVALFVAALCIGKKFELPTIDVSWDINEDTKIETMKVENLKSVKCYGSSMAFKARMQKVRGVHGVKTYVGSHSVVLKYDPTKTNPEKIQEQIFVPSHFRVWSPDPKKLSELKWVTIRTEKMYDKLDLNYLGLQFRTTGKSIFGVESEYQCPLIVRVYMSPEENLDEAWFKEIVEKKVLAMPVHGGGVKETPVDFEFVRLEKGKRVGEGEDWSGTISIKDYLEKMFDPFSAEYVGQYPQGDTLAKIKRVEVYKDKPQFYYEIADQNYEKPIIKRGLPFLSNHLSTHEGIIGTYLCLNEDLVPAIRIRYAAPMTPEEIWTLLTAEKWTITYKKDDVREENPRLTFKKEGVVKPCK